jgi:hypothetical protein
MDRVPILRLDDALLVWTSVDLLGRQCGHVPGRSDHTGDSRNIVIYGDSGAVVIWTR